MVGVGGDGGGGTRGCVVYYQSVGVSCFGTCLFTF